MEIANSSLLICVFLLATVTWSVAFSAVCEFTVANSVAFWAISVFVLA